eukprot:4277041-Prymnesium_polylepis.1
MEHVANGAVTGAANGATHRRSSDVGVCAQPGREFDPQSGQAGVIDRRCICASGGSRCDTAAD